MLKPPCLRVLLTLFFALTGCCSSGQVQPDSIGIHFGFDLAVADDRDMAVLISRVQKLLSEKGRPQRVVVTGHTDQVGDNSYNNRLSLKRAKYVARILRTLLQKDSMEIDCLGVGRSRPLYATDSLNRTVNFQFLFEFAAPPRDYNRQP